MKQDSKTKKKFIYLLTIILLFSAPIIYEVLHYYLEKDALTSATIMD